MKICIIGHFRGESLEGDVGTRNVAYYLSEELSKRHEVLRLDIKHSRWNEIKSHKPDIIHFVLGPTMIGYIAAKLISFPFTTTNVLLSAPNPSRLAPGAILSLLGPDVVLVQSYDSERFFSDSGLRTSYLPNGVDTNRFVPVSKELRNELRVKYGIDCNRFVVLHVGPIVHGRGIEIFGTLEKEKFQVILVGRLPVNRILHDSLKKAGCTIWLDRLKSIEEIYQLSDCYVFPTSPSSRNKAIETPLSILEAMSSNLPVVSTRYGALPRLFGDNDDDGFFYANDAHDIRLGIERIMEGDIVVRTRDKVLPYSWTNIAKKLEEVYCGLKKQA